MSDRHIEPLDTTLGAIVTGVDLADLSDDDWTAIEDAFHQYAILVFPDQHLDDDAQTAFGRRFGELEFVGERDGREIGVVPITNQRGDGSLIDEDHQAMQVMVGNEGWHTDSSYMPVSAKASMLSAAVVPSAGGQTEWADMRAAYDALDGETRERIADLAAYHSVRYSQQRAGRTQTEGYGFDVDEPPLRPLVKEHPVTGRTSLFIGRHAFGIPGLEPADSERLLDELLDAACRPPRTYQHHWRPGDLVVWDNRCVLHRARPFDHREARRMRHTRIAGDPATESAQPDERPTMAGWVRADDCKLDDLVNIIDGAPAPDYPHAASIRQGIPVYDADQLRPLLTSPPHVGLIQAELARAMLDGSGIVAFERAVDHEVLDRARSVFEAIIDEQRARGDNIGDHYAKPGANDRIWNALEKLAVRAPDVFAAYYENDIVALAAEAWLGPRYQVSSQINVVNPGGEAQSPHRDYHLGFLTDEEAEQFPLHVHLLSPVLTLQGAIAHDDMPVEAGPTMYLPHSQKYGPGYVAWRRPEFKQYFADHRAQLALNKGDAVFFNPATFHAAGENRTTDVKRMANLLQISSALGQAMETMDRQQMSVAVYPELLKMRAAGATDDQLQRVVASCADGYAFPTNLDHDRPIGGLAPPTQADVVRQALAESWSEERLQEALDERAARRRS